MVKLGRMGKWSQQDFQREIEIIHDCLKRLSDSRTLAERMLTNADTIMDLKDWHTKGIMVRRFWKAASITHAQTLDDSFDDWADWCK